MFKIGDNVKVQVLKYRFIGEIVNVENDIATVEVPTHYGEGDLVVQSNVNDLWKVIADLEDYKKHKGMYNLK